MMSRKGFIKCVMQDEDMGGYSVENNPLYLEGADRQIAEYLTFRDSIPVIRPSSRRGAYAITFRVFNSVIHVLFRVTHNENIDILDDDMNITHRYQTLKEFLQACIHQISGVNVRVAEYDPGA